MSLLACGASDRERTTAGQEFPQRGIPDTGTYTSPGERGPRTAVTTAPTVVRDGLPPVPVVGWQLEAPAERVPREILGLHVAATTAGP